MDEIKEEIIIYKDNEKKIPCKNAYECRYRKFDQQHKFHCSFRTKDDRCGLLGIDERKVVQLQFIMDDGSTEILDTTRSSSRNREIIQGIYDVLFAEKIDRRIEDLAIIKQLLGGSYYSFTTGEEISKLACEVFGKKRSKNG